MRKYLISAYVQISFSYIMKEISHIVYLTITTPMIEEMTHDEMAEGIRQVEEAMKDRE